MFEVIIVFEKISVTPLTWRLELEAFDEQDLQSDHVLWNSNLGLYNIFRLWWFTGSCIDLKKIYVPKPIMQNRTCYHDCEVAISIEMKLKYCYCRKSIDFYCWKQYWLSITCILKVALLIKVVYLKIVLEVIVKVCFWTLDLA